MTACFDGYEIKLVAEYQFGQEPVEEFDELAVSHCWTLYGHLPEGGLEDILDRPTRNEAIKIYNRLVANQSIPLIIEGPDVDPLGT